MSCGIESNLPMLLCEPPSVCSCGRLARVCPSASVWSVLSVWFNVVYYIYRISSVEKHMTRCYRIHARRRNCFEPPRTLVGRRTRTDRDGICPPPRDSPIDPSQKSRLGGSRSWPSRGVAYLQVQTQKSSLFMTRHTVSEIRPISWQGLKTGLFTSDLPSGGCQTSTP